jgi:hypothetical protein
VSGSVNEVLQEIIGRHGRILLDDHRRCEGCLRDSSLAGRDVSGIMAALKAGIPKRLAAMPESVPLGEKGLANFAAELSESSGLSDKVALQSVQAWAFALRQPPSVKTDALPQPDPPPVPVAAKDPSLSEAIVAAIVVPVIVYAAILYPSFKLFNMVEIPSFIFAFIVFAKGGHSIVSYLTFRFGKKKLQSSSKQSQDAAGT